MQTKLSPEFKNTAHGAAAEAILRSCVHCGFCNATCPTYQVLGDELDGPRGRIYLIKQMLEGGEVGRSTQQHLDRCLTCLNCETTCPSGVEYGKLLSIGRVLVEERVARPVGRRLTRWLLKEGLTSPLFAPLFKAARWARLVPRRLRGDVPSVGPPPAVGSPSTVGPPRAVRPPSTVGPPPAVGMPPAAAWPNRHHQRKMLLLAGCVQPAMLPNINGATARVLDACGIEIVVAEAAGCCGALREHLADIEGGLANARRNIDAWWPWVTAGTIEAIIMNASACGLAVKHYGEALAGDPLYRDKAARVSALARDVSELLPDLATMLTGKLRTAAAGALSVHTPCTLQHGQRLRGGIEAALASLGFDVQPAARESHLCCGSAGTYSVLQPVLARTLRDRKIANLTAASPRCIVSANVGCIQHLQSGTAIPVRHWIEVVDGALQAGS
jgi:glycolate oxidase iron-sulfur subunit